jgi:hypothetical protein
MAHRPLQVSLVVGRTREIDDPRQKKGGK